LFSLSALLFRFFSRAFGPFFSLRALFSTPTGGSKPGTSFSKRRPWVAVGGRGVGDLPRRFPRLAPPIFLRTFPSIPFHFSRLFEVPHPHFQSFWSFFLGALGGFFLVVYDSTPPFPDPGSVTNPCFSFPVILKEGSGFFWPLPLRFSFLCTLILLP